MATNTIDAGLLAKMFLAGAKNLEVKKEWINELNVFPVPDGDTGTNMTLTIMSAVKEVNSLTEVNMYNLSKAISSGSLRGARGNSGVILSQLLRGFTKKIRDYQELNAEILAEAMEKAVETAYKAVMKPKEGTILTVAKGAAEKAAWLYHNTKDAVSEFSKKYNCDFALAEEYLRVVRGIRNQQPFYVTDEDGEETGEDVALDDTWNYSDILWNGIQAEKVQRAFDKLNYREQTLLEKRLAICMTCGHVGSWKGRPTFEELAVMFEGSTASGAERAYRRAVDKLTELLVAEGAIHAVRLKQKSKTKRKKKIATAIYEYQADCDGEWGQISFDFENGTSEIVRLADWDTMKTNRFANKAIAYLLNCENEKLPKETIVAFEL